MVNDPRITAALAEALYEARVIESLTGEVLDTDWVLRRWAEKLLAMPDDGPEQERDGETGDAPGA